MNTEKLEEWLGIWFESTFREAFIDGAESAMNIGIPNFEELKEKAKIHYKEEVKPLLKLNKIIK